MQLNVQALETAFGVFSGRLTVESISDEQLALLDLQGYSLSQGQLRIRAEEVILREYGVIVVAINTLEATSLDHSDRVSALEQSEFGN